MTISFAFGNILSRLPILLCTYEPRSILNCICSIFVIQYRLGSLRREGQVAPATKQLIFGWDTTIGLWGFVILSSLFGEPANLYVLAVAGACAYLPDFDFAPFFALRRRLNITYGHWVFGHYPPVVLPLEVASVYGIANGLWPGHVMFVICLAIVCTSGHFIHDALKPHGFHFLAPLTKDGRVRFPMPWTEHHPRDLYVHYQVIPQWPFITVASPQAVQLMYDDTARMTQSGRGANEIAGRVEPVTVVQLIAFWLGLAGLATLIVKNGFVSPF